LEASWKSPPSATQRADLVRKCYTNHEQAEIQYFCVIFEEAEDKEKFAKGKSGSKT